MRLNKIRAIAYRHLGKLNFANQDTKKYTELSASIEKDK